MDETMSGITLTQAQQILDKLIQAQIDDPIGALGSVNVAGRTVSFKTADDLIKMIDYWSAVVARLQRQAAGGSRHGFAVADFRGRS
jgi:hypothetical protein